MQYLVELVTRIASVTMPNTAELLALGLRGQIVKMAIYLNRYCFALFVPFTIFLLIYGRALIQVWVGPEFAAQAAPLLLPLVVATSFATAGQYNSIGILYGIAKHDMYAKSLIVEAVCLLGGIAAVTPHYGITGAAWVTSVTMILNRGFFTPLLLCRRLELNVFAYMSSIYTRPLILALPSVALGIWMKSSWLPGGNWRQVIVALAVLAVQYYAVYLFAGIEMEHRRTLLEWVSRYLRVIRTASLAALRRNARVGHG
jgi:O-antigen/teichoic acid export membrane protein